MKPPKYSICMVNLNMKEYLQSSLLSIANQLTDEFEIVLVDGGSTDGSVEILREMSEKIPILKLHELSKGNRTLGADRNLSIQLAKGEYVLLHIDCDDLYYNHILDWIKIFHAIEECNNGRDLLVKGCHINMAKRKFLLFHGPYRDLYFEDRDLWSRMHKINALIHFEHKDFVVRMPLSLERKFKKIPIRTFREITENLQQPTNTILIYLHAEFKKIGQRKIGHLFIRIIALPLAIIKVKFFSSHIKKISIIDEVSELPACLNLSTYFSSKGYDFDTNKLSKSSRSIFFGNHEKL